MVRICVIGAGGNGAGHAHYYSRSDRADVVAVADPDAERAGALAEECGARAVSDYRDVLDDVDAVVISSPNQLHRDHAVECAGAGRHIYCEKPMGLGAEQAGEIAAAVREAGVRSVVGFAVRFSDTIQTLHRMTAEGKVGDLVSVWSRRLFYMDLSRTPGWRADHALSGGVLFEINVHELEWMMAVGGPLRSVYGRAYAEGQSSPLANDHIWFTLNFAGGAVGLHEGSQVSPLSEYARGVTGSRAALQTTDWGQRLLFAERGGDPADVPLDPAFDLRGHFLDCVENDARSVTDVDWGLTVMTAADAILESGRTGQVVTLGHGESVSWA